MGYRNWVRGCESGCGGNSYELSRYVKDGELNE